MAGTHVTLSDDVIAAIDERVGEGGRSRFLEEAAREKLERLGGTRGGRRPKAEVIPLPSSNARAASPTIDDVFSEFLAEQEQRLAPRTFDRYLTVIDLLRDCLNGYGHLSLDDDELARWEDARDEEAFTRTFGPDKIAENIGEFLGYFMIRKVMAGEELLRAAGTVTRKLARWLGERGYLDDRAAGIAADRGAEAARDLPKAEKLSRLLYSHAERSGVDIDVDALDDDEFVDDYLRIERVSSGALWLEGGIGPVKVPKAASDIAQPGWSVNIVLARDRGTWHILEVGNVYP